MVDPSDIDALARTLYGEARNQPIQGIQGVACVVLNRVRIAKVHGGYWWGNTIESVCKKPQQFSCWNTNDPNLKIIKKVNTLDNIFSVCVHIAQQAANGDLQDCVNGATHYYAKYIPTPHWAVGKTPVAEIGDHLFYNLEGG